MSVMCLSWSYSLIDLLITQGPREQLAVLAQTAADPHVAAVGLLHRCQRHLDGVSQWRPVSVTSSHMHGEEPASLYSQLRFFFWYIFTCFIKPVWQGSFVTINLTAWNTDSRFLLLCEHLTHGPHFLCSSSLRTQHLVSARNPVKYHCSVLVLEMYKGFYTKDNTFYFKKRMMFLSIGEAFFLSWFKNTCALLWVLLFKCLVT